MPSRIIREGILDSDRIDMLDWPEEVFYRRLMSKVDDFGLFDARPSMLRAQLYPLRLDRVREADLQRWIAACVKAGLIALYSHGGKVFGQMLNTGWQARSEPKHPLPPWGKGDHPLPPVEQPQTVENNCLQPLTPATVVIDVVVDGDGDGDGDDARKRAKPRGKPRSRPLPDGFGISDRVRQWAEGKGYTRLAERLEHFIGYAQRSGKTYADWDVAFMCAIREDWAKLGAAAPLIPPAPGFYDAPSYSADDVLRAQGLG